MNDDLSSELRSYLTSLDQFIAKEIAPLQESNDNNRFFDHRREHARTDWDRDGLPRREWYELLKECRRRADVSGFWRFSLPKQYGGQNEASGRGSNLWMAVIREHLAAKGLGLFNDLQNEHSVVGNFPGVVMVQHFGTAAQKRELIEGQLAGHIHIVFGLTEPNHGSDATYMETIAKPEVRNDIRGWCINGAKMWQTGMDVATHCFVFARTAGEHGDARGITCFIVPRNTRGVNVESYEWHVSKSQ